MTGLHFGIELLIMSQRLLVPTHWRYFAGIVLGGLYWWPCLILMLISDTNGGRWVYIGNFHEKKGMLWTDNLANIIMPKNILLVNGTSNFEGVFIWQKSFFLPFGHWISLFLFCSFLRQILLVYVLFDFSHFHDKCCYSGFYEGRTHYHIN